MNSLNIIKNKILHVTKSFSHNIRRDIGENCDNYNEMLVDYDYTYSLKDKHIIANFNKWLNKYNDKYKTNYIVIWENLINISNIEIKQLEFDFCIKLIYQIEFKNRFVYRPIISNENFVYKHDTCFNSIKECEKFLIEKTKKMFKYESFPNKINTQLEKLNYPYINKTYVQLVNWLLQKYDISIDYYDDAYNVCYISSNVYANEKFVNKWEAINSILNKL